MFKAQKIFIIYAREDVEFKNALLKSMKLLIRQGLIQPWSDEDLRPGDEWDAVIRKHLKEADIILPIISVDFFASDYIEKVELLEAFERYEQGKALIVPIIARQYTWADEPQLARLQALPKDGLPIVKWQHLDDAYDSIYEGLKTLILEKQQSIEAAEQKKREQAAWEKAKNANKPPAYQQFIKAYPESTFLPLAKEKLAQLQAKSSAKPKQNPSDGPRDGEDKPMDDILKNFGFEGNDVFSEFFGGSSLKSELPASGKKQGPKSPAAGKITCIGINLDPAGTSVAAWIGHKWELVPLENGQNHIPAYLTLSEQGQWQIGAAARRQLLTNPRSVQALNPLLGRRYSEVSDHLSSFPFKVVSGSNDKALILLGEWQVTPQMLAALFLAGLKKKVEAHYGEGLSQVVLAIPDMYTLSQRQGLREAAQIAGFDQAMLINRTAAVGLVYQYKSQNSEKQVAICYLDAEAFDVSIQAIGDGIVEIKSVHGTPDGGGDSLIQAVVGWLNNAYTKQEGDSLLDNPMAQRRLWEAAKTAILELSSQGGISISRPYIGHVAGIPKHLDVELTPTTLKNLFQPIQTQIEKICSKAISNAGMKMKEIDDLILAGPFADTAWYQEMLEGLFSKKPKLAKPAEVAAIGSAIRGALSMGAVTDLLLLELIPYDLGIETLGGVLDVIIAANTTIPVRKTNIYSTAEDNQVQVEVHVLEGSAKATSENSSIGRLILSNIPPAPKGIPKIEVAFEIDANGVFSVSAKDLGTGKQQQLSIDGSLALSKTELAALSRQLQNMQFEEK